jgi:MFS family permease
MKKRVKVDEKHPEVKEKIDKSLKLSIHEGAYASVSMGFGQSYFPAFALAMNASSGQIGILQAIVSLFPSLSQLRGSRLIEKHSRRKIVMFNVMGALLMFIPLILSAYLFYRGFPGIIWITIFFAGLYYMFSGFAQPAWFSWMGSLVPGKIRGKYFSKRNRVVNFFSVITMILGALILDLSKKAGSYNGNVMGYTLFAFGFLFFLAMFFRVLSWNLFRRQYEPKIKVSEKDYFSLWQFLKKAPKTPFGRFVFYRLSFSVAIGIAAPFWAVYMLRDLGLSYLWYMVISIAGLLFQLAFLPLFGKAADKFGNIRMIKLCSWTAVAVPLLWYFSSFISDPTILKMYLFLVPGAFAGFAFSGYLLATNNYVYDAVSEKKQGLGGTYMNLAVGIGGFIGSLIGSVIAFIGIGFMNTILFIFLISFLIRLITAIFGQHYLKEVRTVSKFYPKYMIKEFEPVQEVVREFHHLEHMVKEIEHFV